MTEEINKHLSSATHHMDNAIEHLEKELSTLRAGKASAAMFDMVTVDYYGTQTPIGQVANITNADARTLVIQPWEKSMLHPIEKAIFSANLGVTPQNDGILIRINIPPITEERRKDLVKNCKNMGEHAKVSVRNIRRDTIQVIKKITGIPEDTVKSTETKIQDITDKHTAKIDKLLEIKEKEIMHV